MQAYDLIVMGAGPAGAAAAIVAARAGATVLLLERGTLPRQRVCGEFVSAESLALLGELLEDSGRQLLAASPRIGAGRLFVDGRTIETKIDPPAASIARFDLDLSLWHAAERGGVDARMQSSVEGVEGRGPFRLWTSDGIFEAQTLVNATGRWSNLTRGASASDGAGKKWLGVKAHYFEREPVPSVDLYFFEGGYCGVQPVRLAGDDPGRSGNRVNACAMVQADVARNLDEVFARHPVLAGRSNGWKLLMEPVSTSPLVFREPAPVQDGMLYAGDAAGFVDPFVGDGISLALRGGAAAAECVLRFLRGAISREAAEAQYAMLYRQDLLPVFRNSSRLRRLLKLPRVVRWPIAHVLERTPMLASYLVRSTR